MNNTVRVSMLTAILLVMFIAMSASAAETSKTSKDAKKTGIVAEEGETHIYTSAGEQVKGIPAYQIKVNGKTCYYTIDEDGNANKLTGVSKLAAKRLVKLKAGGRKSKKNLKKAFRWCATMPYRSNTKNLKGKKAAKYYGKYGFKSHSGDCNTAAYTFYWMAKVLGYSPKVVQGHVLSLKTGRLARHAWATIVIGGRKYYFDPDFNRNYRRMTVKIKSGVRKLGKYCGFYFTYGTPGTYKYME